MRHLRLAVGMVMTALLATAQFAAPIKSPEVHPDKRVTFRLKAPNAQQVLVSLEGAARLPMEKGEDGVWTLTTQPLAPDMYGYSFVADGVSLLDPGNPQMKPNLLNTTSMVHVPSAEGLRGKNGMCRGARCTVISTGRQRRAAIRGTSMCTPRRAIARTAPARTLCCICCMAIVTTRGDGARWGRRM